MFTLDSFRLDGKIALVAGAGRGMGQAIALGLANLGATVIVADLFEDRLQDTVSAIRSQGHRTEGIRVDVRDRTSVQNMVDQALQKFERIDILAHNAGGMVGILSDHVDVTDEGTWNSIVSLNLTAVYLVVHAVAPIMRKQQEGNIVITASIAGLVGMETLGPYGACKAGVIQLVRALAGELGPDGIRVNSVSPGTIDSPSVREAGERRLRDFGVKDRTVELAPLGRKGLPDDIAGAVAYLASPASSYVTGHNLVVDGGRLAVGRHHTRPREGQRPSSN